MPAPSHESYSGWTQAKLDERNAEQGARLNMVEVDVLCATRDGHDTVTALISATGYTRGQIVHALGVLREQGVVAQEVE
jgi:hypothetical protein